MRRVAKPHPWYHVISPRCMVTLKHGDQCLFTSSYTDVKTGAIFLCSIHAGLADFLVKPIRTRIVTLRDD